MSKKVNSFNYVLLNIKKALFLFSTTGIFLFSPSLYAQELKNIDSLLIKNSDRFSNCMNISLGIVSKMLACLTESLHWLDEDFLRLTVSNKFADKEREIFFKTRNNFCLNKSNYFDGANKDIVYADCLRIKTIENIIKKSYGVNTIDDFVFETMARKKVPDIERENFLKNRKNFCKDATKFQSEYSANSFNAVVFYKDCLVVRAVEESLKRLP